jgi:hypothetical protein
VNLVVAVPSVAEEEEEEEVRTQDAFSYYFLVGRSWWCGDVGFARVLVASEAD